MDGVEADGAEDEVEVELERNWVDRVAVREDGEVRDAGGYIDMHRDFREIEAIREEGETRDAAGHIESQGQGWNGQSRYGDGRDAYVERRE
ncbi:hypothetical protein MSIMFI_05541 [Mycobacterium simulans]|nr:hypothetical protein MSIMFI_05541 [Mycobacterium simulans]